MEIKISADLLSYRRSLRNKPTAVSVNGKNGKPYTGLYREFHTGFAKLHCHNS